MDYRAEVTPVPPEVLFMGSFPPRECGIATFTKDVVDSFDSCFQGISDVVAIDEPGGDARVYDRQVATRLVQEHRFSHKRAAAYANSHPAAVVNVQHEYGLFGGPDGEWFLDFLDALEKPSVVSLHTVLPEPTQDHRMVARRICDRATAVVVLSETGKDILTHGYDVDPDKVHVIHHGVPDVPFRPTAGAKLAFGFAGRTIVSTFGLISRGKGIEYAIEAMRAVVAKHPEVLYLVLGQTHPGVRRHEGESYRATLVDAIAKNGLEEHVALVDRYLAFEELINYLGATDVYLTPYLNPVQIVSGTLAYAVGVGKAIVSTPYLYAKELLADGRGYLADFRDSESLAERINALLDDPWLRRATERRAYRFGRRMIWQNVAYEYGKLFQRMAPEVGRRPAASSALVPA